MVKEDSHSYAGADACALEEHGTDSGGAVADIVADFVMVLLLISRLILRWQCGNIALFSRIGNRALPPEAAALGNGLEWALGHSPVNIWMWFRRLFGGDGEDVGKVDGGSRRAAKGSRGAGDTGTVDGNTGVHSRIPAFSHSRLRGRARSWWHGH